MTTKHSIALDKDDPTRGVLRLTDEQTGRVLYRWDLSDIRISVDPAEKPDMTGKVVVEGAMLTTSIDYEDAQAFFGRKGGGR